MIVHKGWCNHTVMEFLDRQHIKKILYCWLCAVVCAILFTSCVANPPGARDSTQDKLISVPQIRTDRTLDLTVDSIANGFNPHLRSQLSQTSMLISALTLPRPYDQEMDVRGDHKWIIRHDIFTSIYSEIRPYGSQRITYHIAKDAQWSDNAPITGDDFIYLWHQMVTVPGVVNPFGYRLIDNIYLADGGSTVIVVLRQYFIDWQSLFSDLLPSHVLANIPNGFIQDMYYHPTLSGSYFLVSSTDILGAQLVLLRNERYWADPPRLDSIVVNMADEPQRLGASIRKNMNQITIVSATNEAMNAWKSIPGVKALAEPAAKTLTVELNPVITPNINVRQSLLQFIDRDGLIDAAYLGKQNYPASTLVFPPHTDTTSIPQRIGMEEMRTALFNSGYHWETIVFSKALPTVDSINGPAVLAQTDFTRTEKHKIVLAKDNNPWIFVIGVADHDQSALAVAYALADQLASLGIITRVREVPSYDLFGVKSRYFSAVITYNRLGYGTATDAVSSINCALAKRTICDSTLLAKINTMLAGKNLDEQSLYAWNGQLVRLSLSLPLAQDKYFIFIGSKVLLPLPYLTTVDNIFPHAQKWSLR